MQRRTFLRTTALVGASAFFQSFQYRSDPKPIGIHLPSSHEAVKPEAIELNTDSDIVRHIVTSFEKLKNTEPQQTQKIQSTLNAFSNKKGTQQGNGWFGDTLPIRGDLSELMKYRGQVALTPGFSHSLSATTYDGADMYCDPSLKQAVEGESGDTLYYVVPLDDRNDKTPYYVEADLAFMLFNPAYYCIGLPSGQFVEHYLDNNAKAEIFRKTGMETRHDSYRSQTFMYNGSSTKCGGLNTGPVNSTFVYRTDAAIDKCYGFQPMKACGDPKVACKIKI